MGVARVVSMSVVVSDDDLSSARTIDAKVGAAANEMRLLLTQEAFHLAHQRQLRRLAAHMAAQVAQEGL